MIMSLKYVPRWHLDALSLMRMELMSMALGLTLIIDIQEEKERGADVGVAAAGGDLILSVCDVRRRVILGEIARRLRLSA